MLDDAVETSLRLEREDLDKAKATKRPGMRAFVAGRSQRGAETILCGTKGGGWQRMMVVSYGEDRLDRARRYVAEYNAHSPDA